MAPEEEPKNQNGESEKQTLSRDRRLREREKNPDRGQAQDSFAEDLLEQVEHPNDTPEEAAARKHAETLGIAFKTYKEALRDGDVILREDGLWPKDEYVWVEIPPENQRMLNFAIKKSKKAIRKELEKEAEKRARARGIDFRTHEQAVSEGLIYKDGKFWRPREGYEWVEKPIPGEIMLNWATRFKPEIKPTAPAETAPAAPKTAPETKPEITPEPPEIKVDRREAFRMRQIPSQPDWYPKNVHITIDDGPRFDNEELSRILDTLDKHGVKATFFFIGTTIDRSFRENPDRTRRYLRRLVERGHRIGYHSYYHQHIAAAEKPRLDQVEQSAIEADIEKFQKTLDNALGYHYELTIGRMPAGSGTFAPHVIQAFKKKGLEPPKYWHKIWKKEQRHDMTALAQELIKRKKDCIILIHEYIETSDNLDQFLTELKKLKTAPPAEALVPAPIPAETPPPATKPETARIPSPPPPPFAPTPTPVPAQPQPQPQPQPHPPAPEIKADEPVTSYIRLKGYERYGNQMYDRFQAYPVPRETILTRESQAPRKIPLRQTARLNEGANTSGWVPIRSADKLYWRAYYHLRDLVGAGELFAAHKRRKNDNYDDERLADMREKARFHIVSFSQNDFCLAHLPGSNLLKQKKDGSAKGFQENSGTTVNPVIGDTIPWKYRKLTDEQKERAVMVFNGTFHEQDTYYRINGEQTYAGLKVDGKTVITPHEEFATVAIYEDGSARIGTYKNLPNRERIRHLRQNNLMILENGQIAAGAGKNRFRRFQDNLVGSYLGIDNNGNISYIWFTRTPQEVAAKTLQKLGFRDVMLLDIHAVITARVANPGRENMGVNGRDGYEFVPRTGEVGQYFQRQWTSAYHGTPYDFFAILHRE